MAARTLSAAGGTRRGGGGEGPGRRMTARRETFAMKAVDGEARNQRSGRTKGSQSVPTAPLSGGGPQGGSASGTGASRQARVSRRRGRGGRGGGTQGGGGRWQGSGQHPRTPERESFRTRAWRRASCGHQDNGQPPGGFRRARRFRGGSRPAARRSKRRYSSASFRRPGSRSWRMAASLAPLGGARGSIVGNIYKGIVENVRPASPLPS